MDFGSGEPIMKKNGVTRKELFKALATVAKWEGLPPYKIDVAIQNMKKGLNTCPSCGDYLHETNTEVAAPRKKTNALMPFKQGEYNCKSCVGEWGL